MFVKLKKSCGIVIQADIENKKRQIEKSPLEKRTGERENRRKRDRGNEFFL